MDRIMAWQTFAGEALHRSEYGVKPFGDLVLDDGMKHGVDPDVWKLDPRGSVMRFSKLYSFLLVESEPLCRIGRDFWLVECHGGPCGG